MLPNMHIYKKIPFNKRDFFVLVVFGTTKNKTQPPTCLPAAVSSGSFGSIDSMVCE